jgi:hypothetical protein
MQEDRIKCMEPKQNVTTQLNLYMDAWHKKVSHPAKSRPFRLTLTVNSKASGPRTANPGTRTTRGKASLMSSTNAATHRCIRDGRVYIWPGSLLHHLKYLKRPRYEHYEITYANPDNIFDFLGCGKTISQIKLGPEAPVPYIRNDEDQEWDIE